MCTDACTQSLNAYRASVASACGTYMITDPFDSSLYPPTLAADTILSNYNTACEKDGTGTYCATIFATYPTVPSDQGVLGWPTTDLCTACTMGALNITVSNPSTYSVDAWTALQSALKTCGATFSEYNVTNPPTASAASVSVPGPSSTPLGSNSTSSVVCALTGRNITVSSNSTCADLGKQYSITAFDVLQNNPVLSNANCTDGVLPGAALCIPQACTLFSPNGTQTCADVVTAVNQGALAGAGQKITSVQLTTYGLFRCLLSTSLIHPVPGGTQTSSIRASHLHFSIPRPRFASLLTVVGPLSLLTRARTEETLWPHPPRRRLLPGRPHRGRQPNAANGYLPRTERIASNCCSTVSVATIYTDKGMLTMI